MTQNHMTEIFSPDYAKFTIKDGIVEPGERMKKKISAIPFPNLKGKRVLDVGCDYGQFSFYAANKGATYVLGLDRNRDVKGKGNLNLVDLNNKLSSKIKELSVCRFKEINLGKQWLEYGKFDVIFMFSMYHHVFENVGDHEPIWFWLWRNCDKNGIVLWENPVDFKDPVSDHHISGEKRDIYNEKNIIKAASKYFKVEHIGKALHEPNREVYKFTKKEIGTYGTLAQIRDGAKGASKAFSYKNGRRINEINNILGYIPYSGSLNLVINDSFDWGNNYYRAKILDVVDRSKGLEAEWIERWARFYPVTINGMPLSCHVFRFEGEKYPPNFIEIISPQRLRDVIKDEIMVEITA